MVVNIHIIPPAEDAGVRKIGGKKVTEPVDIVQSRSYFVLMPVQAVDGNDAGEGQRGI
jgi:hypothetical protein